MAKVDVSIIRRYLAGRITDSQLRQQVGDENFRTIKGFKTSTRSSSSAARGLGDGFGTLVQEINKATGGMSEFESAALSVGKNLLGANVGGAMAALTKAFADQATKVETLRIGLERLAVQDSRRFITSLRRQQDALMGFGVTLKTLNATTEDFRRRLNVLVADGFGNQEKALTRLAAVNERFGIDIQTSTDLINSLDKGFGISGLGAEKFSRRLLKFARDTGQPFSKVFRDFNGNIKDFFVELDPDKALKKFTIFQQISRRFGTDIGQLTSMVDKFETLEEGAEFGGRLNMLLSNLGGSFDAVQATLMSQPERMQYIAGQVAQVGDRIRGMSDLGQRAVLRELAKTLGTDVGTIRALVNRDKGEDLQRFLKGTSDLQAMGTAEQQKLAMSMTTRDEIRQQTNDKLIGGLAIATETLLKEATKTRQTLVRGAIDSLGEVTKGGKDIIDRASNELATQTQRLETVLNGFVAGLKGDVLQGSLVVRMEGDKLTAPKVVELRRQKDAQGALDNRGGG